MRLGFTVQPVTFRLQCKQSFNITVFKSMVGDLATYSVSNQHFYTFINCSAAQNFRWLIAHAIRTTVRLFTLKMIYQRIALAWRVNFTGCIYGIQILVSKSVKPIHASRRFTVFHVKKRFFRRNFLEFGFSGLFDRKKKIKI